VTFRGVAELIRDGAWAQEGWTQSRRPVLHPDKMIIGHITNAWHAEQRQEAAELSTDDASRSRRAIDLVNPNAGHIELAAGNFDARAAADEWRSALDGMKTTVAVQAQASCGPTDELGYCRAGSHTHGCSESRQSAVMRATFADADSPEGRHAWQAAVRERAAMRAAVRPPGAGPTAAEQRADRAREAREAREERLASGRTAASEMASGRFPGWMVPAAPAAPAKTDPQWMIDSGPEWLAS
jgi:hypothetical protein